ncbi:MAG: hypothetical protein MUP21_13445 [Dehalococcoidia bacterium]|nr:hypothetical protein [Dehalococcoidia bacterium]
MTKIEQEIGQQINPDFEKFWSLAAKHKRAEIRAEMERMLEGTDPFETRTAGEIRAEMERILDETDPPITQKTMVLSTVHVTPEDFRRLDVLAKVSSCSVRGYENGCSLVLADMPSQEDYPMSILFQSVLAYAAHHKCDVLDLDRDGKVMDCLAEFDWP